MSVLQFLATLLGGGVLGVALRAGHERGERARDRLLDTAEQLLTAYEAAREEIERYRRRTSETMAARAAIDDATQAETQAMNAAEPNDNGPLHDAQRRVHTPLQRWMPRMTRRFMEAWDEEARARFDLELAQTRERLGTEAAGGLPEVIRTATSETLDAVERWGLAAEEQAVVFGSAMQAQYRVSAALARVMVVFAPRRHVSREGWRISFPTTSASDEAGQIATALGAAMSVIISETQAGRDPGPSNQNVSDAMANLGTPVQAFSLATNRAVRRRVWI